MAVLFSNCGETAIGLPSLPSLPTTLLLLVDTVTVDPQSPQKSLLAAISKIFSMSHRFRFVYLQLSLNWDFQSLGQFS